MQARISNTLCASLVTLILSLFGWQQVRELKVLALSQSVANDNASQSKDILFSGFNGVDVTGHPIELRPNGLNKIVAFIIHNDSIKHDLAVWDKVAELVKGTSKVQIMGVCDSKDCASQLNHSAEHPFTVAMFGDITDTEALLNADVDGNALEVVENHNQKVIFWKGASVSAKEIAQEVLR